MPGKSIFFDPSGRRARRLSAFGWVLALIGLILAVAFTATIMIVPETPAISYLRSSHLRAIAPAKSAEGHLKRTASRLASEVRARQQGVPRSTHPNTMQVTPPSGEPTTLVPPADRPLAIGFYTNWDDTSYASLKRGLPTLDWVVPSWLSLQGQDMALNINLDRKSIDLIRRVKPQTSILPMLQNATDGVWNGKDLAHLLADPVRRSERLRQIIAFLAENHLQGLTIDFESIPKDAHKDLLAFLAEMRAAFDARHWVIAMAVPFDDAEWNYAAYAKVTDYLMLMAYDEHWEEGSPGSIASQQWFEQVLARRMAELEPSRVIICIGNYGYDWSKAAAAEDVTFQEVMLKARESGAEIAFDDDLLNPHFSYEEDDGVRHDVWFLDGVTAFNQIQVADEYRPAGYALWRLGSEDPSTFNVLGRPYGSARPDGLASIAMGQDVDFEGTGEILRIDATPSPGARTMEIDPDTGLVSAQSYTRIPSSYVIQRLGAVPKKVALTFDDGPDPQWTPKILDILKQKNVKASFFIIGENGESNPGLVRRIFKEGHDVGNHTFTHPNLGETPSGLTELELNATQRLFEALTGHTMRLFRPPYFGDAEPTTADELVPVERAQELGYLTVGLRVDPDDWQQPPANLIVERVLQQLSDPNPEARGQVVLLHDSGGDRSQTVAALPLLIDALRARGYELVPVSALAGLTAEQAMPKLVTDGIARATDRTVFLTMGWFEHALGWVFRFAIALGLLRVLFLCVLAVKQYRSRSMNPTVPGAGSEQLVSVLVPAYNEGKVIGLSVKRILDSDYQSIEVIVIDDGSTDDTSRVIASQYGDHPRVRLLTLANGGKARAVNTGLQLARGEIIVALDADTQFEPDCIRKLVRWFDDPEIGAVAGNAKVGNRMNVITRWQALEYITAQNLERRALATLDCITVVPGAVGAWRRSALDELGGFPADTLAEDQDLTLSVLKAGYRIVYDDEAVAWTEAPQSVAGLATQRFRWAFGTLQCLWKHRDALLRPRFGTLGLVALPQAWLFQIVFGLISPLVDLALVWQIGVTALNYMQHPQQTDSTNLMITVGYYALFTVVDLLAGIVAFAMERGEQWRLLGWLIPQRFGYRQIMYYVVVKSVLAAIRGPAVGWGKLDRNASVKAET